MLTPPGMNQGMNIIFLRLAFKMITFLTDRAYISPPFTLHLPSSLPCLLGRSPSIVDGTWNVTAGAVVDGGDAVRSRAAKRRPQFER